MGRPIKRNVEYFPHFIGDGKKMFYIEHKYGNDGYSTWFKILETLGDTDNHFLDLSSPTEVMFLSAKCRVAETMLIDILDDLCRLGEIDPILWGARIVWSDKFVESIQDAYKFRKNRCVEKIEIIQMLQKVKRLSKKDFQNAAGAAGADPAGNDEVEKPKHDWQKLLMRYNEIFQSDAKIVPEKAKKQFNARLESGNFTKDDVINAMINVRDDEYHKSQKYRHATLEFFSREDILAKWSSKSNIKPENESMPKMKLD